MDIHALVVDDSGIMRKMVMRSLSQSGLANFTFTEACDGADALEKFDPETISMMFVDWNMPNMPGIDLIRAVRSAEVDDHVPIVMITTESTMDKIEEALDQAGVDSFIVKPFTVDVLRKKLTPLFEKITAEIEGKSKGGGFFGKLAKAMN